MQKQKVVLKVQIGKKLKFTKAQRKAYEKARKENLERLRPHIEAAERSGRITAEDLSIIVY